jgi:hypothetical protein
MERVVGAKAFLQYFKGCRWDSLWAAKRIAYLLAGPDFEKK